MTKLTMPELTDLIGSNEYSVVHIDADWDGYRFYVHEKIFEVAPKFKGKVAFGYVDCDEEQEFAIEIGLLNTPSVAYYAGSQLKAVVIGAVQDIEGNIDKLIRGDSIKD